jgi:hypothetical protein
MPFKIVSKPSLVSTLFTKSIVSIIYCQSRKSGNPNPRAKLMLAPDKNCIYGVY